MSRTITQRELRNESAAIMDAVEQGESLIVTRNGNPVAELRPLRARATFVATAELQRVFRQLPAMDYSKLRADLDTLLGEDRLEG